MRPVLSNWQVQVALGLSAASALIYEVVATNVLFFYFIESSYSVATVLSVFLAGLGIGSFLVYKYSERIVKKKRLFGILQIIIAGYALLFLTQTTEVVSKISNLNVFVASISILLIPTIFLGAIFPLAGSLFMHKKREMIGLVYSSDLFGAIIGALLAGFVLIPLYGNKAAVIAGAIINLVSSAVILPTRTKFVPVILAVLGISFFAVQGVASKSILTDGVLLGVETKDLFFGAVGTEHTEDKFSKPSPYGIIKVNDIYLYINERRQCAYYLTMNERMMDSAQNRSNITEYVMVDHVLGPFQGGSPSVLSVGLGCGTTLSRITDLTEGQIDVVEINPVVLEATQQFFPAVLDNENVNIIIDDGLHFLRTTDKIYDSIIIDIENSAVAHASNLYTVEAFKSIYDSLSDDGTFALWDYQRKGRYLDVLYYTLHEYFPYVYKKPDVFLASKQKLDFEPYIPQGPYEINSINKRNLVQAYVESYNE